MRVETCRVGGALRLDGGTRIEVHDRQGERVGLGVTVRVGTPLILGGAMVSPIPVRIGVWRYLFSLGGCRRFVVGPHEVRLWLPGELVPLAADCSDWVHVGVTQAPGETARAPRGSVLAPLPGAVVLHGPWQARDVARAQSRGRA